MVVTQMVGRLGIDQEQRMFCEALDRLRDAETLACSARTTSDSGALLRILAFEIMLKCTIRLSGQVPKRHHHYERLWTTLPELVQTEILDFAKGRSPGHTDFSDLPKLLRWYQFIFEKARYHYELYEGYTLDEQRRLGELWEELGAPIHEAVVQYYPEELYCLIEGLREHLQKHL